MPSTGDPALDLALFTAATAPVAYLTKRLYDDVLGGTKSSSNSEDPKGGEQGKQDGAEKAANPEEKKT